MSQKKLSQNEKSAFFFFLVNCEKQQAITKATRTPVFKFLALWSLQTQWPHGISDAPFAHSAATFNTEGHFLRMHFSSEYVFAVLKSFYI